jgi:hypothetical protein
MTHGDERSREGAKGTDGWEMCGGLGHRQLLFGIAATRCCRRRSQRMAPTTTTCERDEAAV